MNAFRRDPRGHVLISCSNAIKDAHYAEPGFFRRELSRIWKWRAVVIWSLAVGALVLLLLVSGLNGAPSLRTAAMPDQAGPADPRTGAQMKPLMPAPYLPAGTTLMPAPYLPAGTIPEGEGSHQPLAAFQPCANRGCDTDIPLSEARLECCNGPDMKADCRTREDPAMPRCPAVISGAAREGAKVRI